MVRELLQTLLSFVEYVGFKKRVLACVKGWLCDKEKKMLKSVEAEAKKGENSSLGDGKVLLALGLEK